jgi:hypothetical protein
MHSFRRTKPTVKMRPRTGMTRSGIKLPPRSLFQESIHRFFALQVLLRFGSVTFPSYGDGCKLKGDRLYIQGMGLLKIKLHRPVGDTIKTVTLKREGTRWYAVLVCEVPVVPLPATGQAVGIDLGLASFLMTDAGKPTEHPQPLRAAQARLRRAQRSLRVRSAAATAGPSNAAASPVCTRRSPTCGGTSSTRRPTSWCKRSTSSATKRWRSGTWCATTPWPGASVTPRGAGSSRSLSARRKELAGRRLRWTHAAPVKLVSAARRCPKTCRSAGICAPVAASRCRVTRSVQR